MDLLTGSGDCLAPRYQMEGRIVSMEYGEDLRREACPYFDCIHCCGGYNDRMPLSATIEQLPEATAVVTLSGQMTLGTSLKVADSQIHGLISDGVRKLVIDLAAVDYMDSAGLGLLVFIFGTLREKAGSLRVCGVAPRLLSVLQLTKTDTFLAIDQDREESLAALAA